MSDLPEFTAEQVTSARDALFEVLRKAGGRTQREIDGKDDIQAVPKKKSRSASNNSYPPTTREDVESALKAVPNDSNWHTWVKVGAALWDALADEGEDAVLHLEREVQQAPQGNHQKKVEQLPQVVNDHRRADAVLDGAPERVATAAKDTSDAT